MDVYAYSSLLLGSNIIVRMFLLVDQWGIKSKRMARKLAKRRHLAVQLGAPQVRGSAVLFTQASCVLQVLPQEIL